MRWPTSVAALVLACSPTTAQEVEQIVVTATRHPLALAEAPLSISVVGTEALDLVGATHPMESVNRAPGAMLQRASGQESLTAIRSPVLTGAGSCGAFLFMENGISIRPVGFCNVNELFEVNTEQAAAIEVLRGPGTALYGSGAMHGAINVLQPGASERARTAIGIEAGPDDYWRAKAEGRAAFSHADGAVAALFAHDGGWRDESGYEQAKLNAVLQSQADSEVPWRVDLAATALDQETAGFVLGEDAYEDEALSRSNPNPEAYRDAGSLRLSALLEPALIEGARVELRPYLRHSRMDFLQHFLLGQPLERNGQDSIGLLSSATWDDDGPSSLTAGLDLEWADTFLVEEQEHPTTGGPPAANAIRPVGLHYDYTVRSTVAAGYVQGERALGEHWTLGGGVRVEHVAYDYDNRMLAGNTDENGVPCTPAGCLYSRPADRRDDFTNVTPRIHAAVQIHDGVFAYAVGAIGYRAPETTELYRLQRQQSAADLDAERLQSLEIGVRGAWREFDFEMAAFDMRKRDVILRESNGVNVADGKTSHEGIEYRVRWEPDDRVGITASGSFARHRYDFSRTVEGGESILAGNDVDTAPRQTHRASIDWRPAESIFAEAEWLAVGDYWLDAANAHSYPGHELLNLRAAWRLAPAWRFTLRLANALDRDYADRADFAFGNYRYLPGRGRALFAEVNWRR